MYNILSGISDIYIDVENTLNSFSYPGPKFMRDEEGIRVVERLMDETAKTHKQDFVVNIDGIRWRGARIPSVKGDFYIFRRMPDDVWSLDQCGIRTVVKKMLLEKRLNKGGLIVVSGMPGNGKSTSCAAIIAERLKVHGGVCNTIEDPAEMPLHGFHGEGFCIQREVDRGESAYEAVIDTLRAYPAKTNTMMLIGEVRDASTASLALQSAVDGRLVLITTHASGVIETVRRIINIASGPGGTSHDQAKELFAAAFRLVMHQKLENDRLRVNVLADSSAAASVIRSESDLVMLQNVLKEQTTKFKQGEMVPLRAV